MSLKISPRVSEEDINSQLDDLLISAKSKFPENEVLIRDLTTLVAATKHVTSFAHEYDFRDTQANGYWSLVFLVLKLIKFGVDYYDSNNEKFVTQFESLIKTFIDGYASVRDMRDHSVAERPSNILQANLDISAAYFCPAMAKPFETWQPVMDEFAGFFYGRIGRFVARFIEGVIPILGVPASNILKVLFDSDYRQRQLIAQATKFDVGVVKLLASFGESPISTRINPFSYHFFQPNVLRTVFIPRQKRYVLDYVMESQKIFIQKEHRYYLWGAEPVRCRLLHKTRPPVVNDDGESVNQDGNEFGDAIIIHCHGGGFITGTPDSHEIYLRGWAKNLVGVPILSIDYALSPGAKFPVASQQILDTYLWATSGGNDVIDMFGFHPKRVIVSGDSSGGLLLMVNTLILNDIRKEFGDGEILMPAGLVGFYSSFTIEALLTPSFIVSCVHPFLFPSVFCEMVDAYIPDGIKPGLLNGATDLIVHEEPTMVEYVKNSISGFFTAFSWYYDLYKNLYSNQNLWYMEGEEVLKSKLRGDMKFTSHPYLSPLNYEHLDDLKNMRLHLVSIPFEPILDHSVMMARKWAGPAKLDICGELVHAFLNCMPFGGEYEEAYRYSIEILKQALEP